MSAGGTGRTRGGARRAERLAFDTIIAVSKGDDEVTDNVWQIDAAFGIKPEAVSWRFKLQMR